MSLYCVKCLKEYKKESYYLKHIEKCKDIPNEISLTDKCIIDLPNETQETTIIIQSKAEKEFENKTKKLHCSYVSFLEKAAVMKSKYKEVNEYSHELEKYSNINCFKEFIKELTKCYNISFNKLWRILDNIKINRNQVSKYNKYLFSNILINPFLFINDGQILIPFRKCIQIKNNYNLCEINDRDINNAWVLDFILNPDNNKNKSFYIDEKVFQQNYLKFCREFKIEPAKFLKDTNVISKIIKKNKYLTTSYFYELEKSLTDKFLDLFEPSKIQVENFSLESAIMIKLIGEFENKNKLRLTEKQKNAVIECINNEFQIVCGFPGTGKTTIVQCYLYILDCIYPDRNILNNTYLLAPTGLAVCNIKKNCSESKLLKIPSFNCLTIHKFLKIRTDQQYYYQNEDKNGEKEIENEESNIETTKKKISELQKELQEVIEENLKIEKNQSKKRIQEQLKRKKQLEKNLNESQCNLNNSIHKIKYLEKLKNIPQVIVIDEVSMIDLIMFKNIVNSFECLEDKNVRLIFLGDLNQLPPINCGNALYSLKESQLYNIIELDEIKRQSGTLKDAVLKMNKQQEKIEKTDFDDKSLYFIDINEIFVDNSKIEKKIRDLERDIKQLKTSIKFSSDFKRFSSDLIKDKKQLELLEFNKKDLEKQLKNDSDLINLKEFLARFELDPSNTQFITPQKTYNTGYENINILLQTIFNPDGRPIDSDNNSENFVYKFKTGDYICRTVNSYEENEDNSFRANGEVGIIQDTDDYELSKDLKEEIKIFHYDNDIECVYSSDLYSDFSLNYAKSIHKVQGSQYDNVVIIMSPSHTFMWTQPDSKKLLYTAISRAKEKCIIIGTEALLKQSQETISINPVSVFLKESNNHSFEI